MDFLLVMTYTALCVAIFKIFRIPLNKWTVPTAFLGGVVIIGALIFTMNYNHPFSEITRTYFVTTPIVAPVRGLRPLRAARLPTLKVPKPTSETLLFFFSVCFTPPIMASRARVAAALEISA